MKKIQILILFIFLLIPAIMRAESGTCSWHGGVNCSAGPDWDYSAICNDGWRDSTERYYGVSMCSNQVWCTPNEYSALQNQYGISQLTAELNSIYEEIVVIKAQLQVDLQKAAEEKISFPNIIGEQNHLIDEANDKINSLYIRADSIIFSLDVGQSNANSQCLELGEKAERERIQARNQAISDFYTQLNSTQNQPLQCDVGYFLSNNQCISHTQNCQDTFGPNVIGVAGAENKSSCSCISGYRWNTNKTACTLIQQTSVDKDNLSNIYTINPGDVNALINFLGATRNQADENKYTPLVTNDAAEFAIVLTDSQKISLVNFITYGISDDTVRLGAGERRAVLRDYLETVGKSDVIWNDIRKMVNGQKVEGRNLTKESSQVPGVLKVFKMIFGHDPIFSNSTEDLFWNTLMYRIRFPRDLEKEKNGIIKFKNIFGKTPITPLDWATVRGLGYVK